MAKAVGGVPGLLTCLLAALLHAVAPAGAVEIVGRSGTALELEVNKGRLVRLERAAATVFVANPEIADIQVKSPRLVYMLGRSPAKPPCTRSTRPNGCSPTSRFR
ncbi:MAG: pilus assembly protein N-terminal domain-containing protein [Rhodospirillales bacterium]|nr:pilus assembly protein N-terminal domain-containing protein [Rhodospirillales bacterium]